MTGAKFKIDGHKNALLTLAASMVLGLAGCDQQRETVSSNVPVWTSPKKELTPAEKQEELVKKAEQGDSNAQYDLAQSYQSGKGSTKDMAKATEWYEKAAVQGHKVAQSKLSMIYARGEGTPKDATKVIDWTQQSAEQGDANAQIALSWLYGSGKGIAKDLTKAVDLIKKAAAQNNAEALYIQGVMYKSGIRGFVQKDLIKSAESIQKAADMGLEDAQKELARMYLKGSGVPKDIVKAMSLWEKSASQGNAESQMELARMYEKGDGFQKDAVKAFEWWQKAAEQGDPAAEYSMGRMYGVGRGVPTDAMKSFEWIKKAAIKGYSIAQSSMSSAYTNGEGVVRDDVLAYAWGSLAQSKYATGAVEMKYWGFVKNMLPEQIAEGQRLSSAWKKGQTIARETSQNSATPGAAPNPSGGLQKQGTATAFFVSKTGQAITNHHAINGCKEVRIPGRAGVVQVSTTDSVNDLALLLAPGVVNDIAVINAEQGKTRQGDDIVVYGFPLNSVLSSGGNLTPGIVSAMTGLDNNTNQLQITAPIQPGSSGSPVLNKKGEVVGVVSAKLSDSKMAKATGSVGQNVNFAVTGQTLKSFLDAHKVDYSTGGLLSMNKSTADIADEARKWTTVVECWR